jgi:hypothetical protein
MRALFIELPAFERLRNEYLDDESFRAMQNALMDDPSAGDVIQWTGGLRSFVGRTSGAARASAAACELYIFAGSVDWNSGFSLYMTRMY